MFGGGEEYFAPPEEFSVETLRRFAELCTKLRRLDKPKQQAIKAACEAADAVGTTMAEKEIAAGAVARSIRFTTGDKQLCAWYVLDNLVKNHPDTFRYLFGLVILELGLEHIPWEDGVRSPKYESLTEHWSCVFPPHVVKQIFDGRSERKWAAANPEEAAQMKREEERVWEEEERKHQEIDGLDDYAQPCLAYMQGTCSWGARCSLLHPPGLEGTLPPECRLGDWRCPDCGSINRHFRRRCYSCPREKPQYRRSDVSKQEDAPLCQADTKTLKSTFAAVTPLGYDPCDEGAAVGYWNHRLPNPQAVQEYLIERREKYKSVFLKNSSSRRGGASASGVGQKRTERSEDDAASLPASQARHVEVQLPALPPTMPARDRVFFIAARVVQRGVHDPQLAGHLFLLCQALNDAVRDPQFAATVTPELAASFVDCCRLVYKGWCVASASGADVANHPATPFFSDVRRLLPAVPALSATQREELGKLSNVVAPQRK
jgi:hypothetical protein